MKNLRNLEGLQKAIQKSSETTDEKSLSICKRKSVQQMMWKNWKYQDFVESSSKSDV